ncbi:MAG: 2-amino-4-hydroxy-6-hydroxymethyldihydropteridine diphosphokinase [Proteiniphilum sp.]
MAYSIILALGSNLGDKRQNIAFALNQIEERIGSITSLSALYDTLPVGFYSTHNFVNCVCEVDTNLNISDLFSITQEIEKEMGRSNKSTNANYSDRIIDIDLIMAGNLILQTERLTIPHPLFHTRDFVLMPLCEIAPERIHPVIGKTIRRLKEELDQKKTQPE